MMVEHTPTPWRISGKTVIRTDTGHTPSDELIGSLDWRNRPANAEFIVRAVNCHDDLVVALKMAREWVKSLHNEGATVTSQGALDQIDAALAKAEGRS